MATCSAWAHASTQPFSAWMSQWERRVTWFISDSASVNPLDLPGVPPGTAVTNRTVGFGAQPLFPSGIDGTAPGPFFQLYRI